MIDLTPSTNGRKRILVVEPIAEEGLAILRTDHDVEVLTGLERSEFLRILPEYDALLVRSQVQADAEAIAAGTRLAVIGRAGVGVDNIDLPAATNAGITVVNAPTGNTIAAAEHTLALLFAARTSRARGGRVGQARRVETRASSRESSSAARRWASLVSERSAWRSPTALAAWRWRCWATIHS